MGSDEFDVGLDGEEPGVPLEAVVDASAVERKRRFDAAPSLEEYVAEHVEAAKRLVAGGVKDPQQFSEPTPGDDRVSRAEKYARWRWQGYIDGDVGSL